MNLRAVVIAAAVVILSVPETEAAEIKILSVPAMRPVFNDLGPMFERSTGHRLVIKFEFASAAKRQIEAGELFDLLIAEPTQIDDLITQGKIVASTRADLGYVGLGVGARAGTPKPDISSVEAFKRTLLEAKSIAYQPDTGSGLHFAGLLERLGIAADVKAKLKPKPGGAALPSVASGEAEIVVTSIPGILATPGVELVGPLPSELQFYIRFRAGVSAAAMEPDAVIALVKFLMSEPAGPVLKAKGMQPGAP